MKHYECKKGAAVRLHGYAPARVTAVYVAAHDDKLYAECVVTGRNWRGQIGPHGYRSGQRVNVRACEAVPRDVIRTQRGSGRIVWDHFTIRTTGKYHETPEATESDA